MEDMLASVRNILDSENRKDWALAPLLNPAATSPVPSSKRAQPRLEPQLPAAAAKDAPARPHGSPGQRLSPRSQPRNCVKPPGSALPARPKRPIKSQERAHPALRPRNRSAGPARQRHYARPPPAAASSSVPPHGVCGA